jgi:5-methylcytosine-specific restriction protein B
VAIPWTKNGSLTRHFLIADIPQHLAAMPDPASHDQVQAALDEAGNQHSGLAVRLFEFDEHEILVEDEVSRQCRAETDLAPALVFVALVMGDERVARAIENFLTNAAGRLDPQRFSSAQLTEYLANVEQIGETAPKVASNLLRWFHRAAIIDPQESGKTIVGIARSRPTGQLAQPVCTLLAERFKHHGFRIDSAVDLAIGIGANRWINLTPDEFRRAATGIAVLSATRGTAVPEALTELHAELYRKGQVVLQGPPGTGKTRRALDFVDWFSGNSRDQANLDNIIAGLPANQRSAADVAARCAELPGVWTIVQFHTTLSYDDFVRSLQAVPVEGGVTFEPVNKSFGFICDVAKHLADAGSETEVLMVIDEINRADLSKVFGELIYGLEYRDQPIGTPYEVDGNKSLVVPSNVYLIGTMNTADRSIALIDYALRRRFVYLNVPPDRSVFSTIGFDSGDTRVATVHLFDQVAELFGGDAELRSIQPGHSYFLPDDTGTSHAVSIARKFAYELVPLLIEYEAEGRFVGGGVATLLSTLGCQTILEAGTFSQTELAAELAGKLTDNSFTNEEPESADANPAGVGSSEPDGGGD